MLVQQLRETLFNAQRRWEYFGRGPNHREMPGRQQKGSHKNWPKELLGGVGLGERVHIE
jgi:hypothetical protein